MQSKKILIVEDENIIANDIKRTLTSYHYMVTDIVSSGEKAIESIQNDFPDIILMDINLEGDMTGIETAQKIKEEFYIPVIYLTAYNDDDTLNEAKITEPFGYILKPFEARTLNATIEMAFYKNGMERRLKNNERFLRKVIDSIPNYIYVKNKNREYVLANKKVADFFNTNIEDVIGKKDEDFAHKVLLDDKEVKKFTKHYKSPIINEEQYFRLKNEKIKWFKITDIPLIYLGNRHTLGVIVDITDIKTAEHSIQKRNAKLKKLLQSTVEGLVNAVEMRDPYTAGHQRRVAELSVAIARKLNMEPDKLEAIKMAALLHDIGKMYIPAEILTKPSKLSDIELKLIKMHPEVGYDILKDIEFPWPIAQIVRQHHERKDGSGYPDGLKDKEILYEAQIIGIADVVEAMSSHRPYRASLGIYYALKEIEHHKDIYYKTELVETVFSLFNDDGFEFSDKYE